MENHSLVLPGLSPVAGKPTCAALDGDSLTSDAGVLVGQIIRFRRSMIPAGYPDADDSDASRAERIAPKFSEGPN